MEGLYLICIAARQQSSTVEGHLLAALVAGSFLSQIWAFDGASGPQVKSKSSLITFSTSAEGRISVPDGKLLARKYSATPYRIA